MAYWVAIVDDSTKDAEFVQGILNNWAYLRQANIQAELFPSAEAFLFRYAEDKDWDILLLDIEMGAMDGVTMAKRVRQDSADRVHRRLLRLYCRGLRGGSAPLSDEACEPEKATDSPGSGTGKAEAGGTVLKSGSLR